MRWDWLVQDPKPCVIPGYFYFLSFLDEAVSGKESQDVEIGVDITTILLSLSLRGHSVIPPYLLPIIPLASPGFSPLCLWVLIQCLYIDIKISTLYSRLSCVVYLLNFTHKVSMLYQAFPNVATRRDYISPGLYY